jgi:hypothetical protein
MHRDSQVLFSVKTAAIPDQEHRNRASLRQVGRGFRAVELSKFPQLLAKGRLRRTEEGVYPVVWYYFALVIAPCEAEATRAAYLLNTPAA